jgi:hypothetical protein
MKLAEYKYGFREAWQPEVVLDAGDELLNMAEDIFAAIESLERIVRSDALQHYPMLYDPASAALAKLKGDA